jgi:type IV pilus assembly protein PilM
VIYRNYIGLDLQSNALRAVVLRRHRTSAELVAGRVLGLSEHVLSPGQKSANILDPATFSSAVREVLDPMSAGEDRIALALPEACGRLLLLQVDTPLKSREEGAEVLQWHLRDTLPPEVPVQLDYQVLSRDENGRQRVAVACVAKHILSQYEDVLADAGYGAESVLFRSLCQYNFYRYRLDPGDDFLLIFAEGTTLTFQAYRSGELVYHRARETALTPEIVFRELSRVLAGEGARLGSLRREAVYLHAPADVSTELLPVLESLFERPVRLLDIDLASITARDVSISASHRHDLIAAIGAAEGLM